MITNGILPQTPGADSFRRVLGSALASPLALQRVEGREEQTRQLRGRSKESIGKRHDLASGIGPHRGSDQRDTEEGKCCEPPLSAPKKRSSKSASEIKDDEYAQA